MAGNVLNKAASLLRRKKYAQVIRILEPQVFRFRQNSQYYYILGMSYLYTGDIAGAGTYMKRVVQLSPDNIEARLAVAAIHVKLGQNQKAIETWLEVLESDPSNKTAKRGLDLLRQSADNPEILENVLSSAQFSKILPVRKRKIYLVPVIAVILIVFIVPLVSLCCSVNQ